MHETGHFASLWRGMAERHGLDPEFIAGDWRRGADAEAIGARLAEAEDQANTAACVVYNAPLTGATSRSAAVPQADDASKNKARPMVATISPLPSLHTTMESRGSQGTL